MPYVENKTTKGFRGCFRKGFHITFPNGWTVSVQFGGGNYCENYDMIFEKREVSEMGSPSKDMESNDAEVWCWNTKDKHWPENPLANQTPLDVLKILNKISKRKKG
jgi:hypothetical protein